MLYPLSYRRAFRTFSPHLATKGSKRLYQPANMWHNDPMQILRNEPLSNYSTMRLGGDANALVTVKNKQELLDALAWAKEQDLPFLLLGGGSNVIFSNGFAGLVIINHLAGFEILSEDARQTTICVGAGENWDNVVERTVKMSLHGIELLSAIPGTAGATPVQNVGAYGTDISETLVELEAYDLQEKRFTTLTKEDCQFTYRHSIFKNPKKRRYIITSVTLRLLKEMPKPPFYDSLQRYLDDHSITTFTPQIIRDSVVAIRAVKLPDPSKIANTGSFFKNPIVPATVFNELAQTFPSIPNWPTKDGRVKLAAGWLIEQAGLKDYRAHGMKTYENHALVLVNESAKNYEDLLQFKNEIVKTVRQKFGVTLEQEPELL